MLSLEDTEAIKIAVEICNESELKRKILLAPDDVKISGNKFYFKHKWDEMVERQAMATLESRILPKNLQQKVMDLVPAIAMRMLKWAVYHEGTLLLSRQYSINFLNSSLFTQQGIIDNKKAAQELMKDENLSIVRKYKIACLYCFTDDIPDLFKQMADTVKGDFHGFRRLGQPELLRFWSYYLMGKEDEIKGGKTVERYFLDKAIESGSKAAVEYCFEKTNLRMEKDALVDAAVEAIRNRRIASDDWIVFRDAGYDGRRETWVPSAYYVDIVCFLLSKMTKDQQIEFLKKDIEGAAYERSILKAHNRSRVLEYFLYWPYQNYFMETAELMWEFLPEENYADLLLDIYDKIDYTEREEILKIGEVKSYDYRCLLKEFWYQSPERYKRYVLCNQVPSYQVELLINLLSLKKFTFEDGQNIGVVLACANDEAKEYILSHTLWRDFFVELIKEEKLEILDRFVLSHFSSVRVSDFKRKLIFSRKFQDAVFDFVENAKWDAVESAIKWSSLSVEEVNTFKEEILYSEDAAQKWLNLILSEEGVDVANKFIEWCTDSEEEIRACKEYLMFSIGSDICKSLVLEDNYQLLDKITNCWLSSQEKIKQFKDEFQCSWGDGICEFLISDYSERNGCNGVTITFLGGKWEEVEKFLTWCFPSEEEIADFKKSLLRDSGKVILLNLITSSQWPEAEIFFAWLGLSTEEMKKLKKDTVLDGDFILFFHTFMCREDEDPFFVPYGSKKEAIELILRWCLPDKETVLEFKQKFENWREDLDYHGGELQDVLCMFNWIIEQHLKDILEEERGVKRKFETVFSLNKKLCNIKLENLD